MEHFDNTVGPWLAKIANNDYASAAMVIFLVAYSSHFVPRFPYILARYMDNIVVKVLVFFLLAFYLGQKSPTTSLLVAVGVVVFFMLVNWFDAKWSGFEHFAVDVPVNGGDCTVTMDSHDKFYPQYANLKPDAYMARYTGNDVDAYDPTARYMTDQ